MVAVPKERSSELLKYSRSDFMVPIDILGGRFYVQDYDVVICLIDGDCAALRHVMEERDDVKICSGINIPENDILFWQSL